MAANPAQYRTAWTYDGAGNILTETDALGRTTNSTYDGNNRLLTQTDATTRTTTFAYNQAGEVISKTEPAGLVTTYDYDRRGQMVRQTSPSGAASSYTYDAAGRQVAMVEPRGNVAGANPADYRWSYTYDEAGNQTTITDPLTKTTTQTYDAPPPPGDDIALYAPGAPMLGLDPIILLDAVLGTPDNIAHWEKELLAYSASSAPGPKSRKEKPSVSPVDLAKRIAPQTALRARALVRRLFGDLAGAGDVLVRLAELLRALDYEAPVDGAETARVGTTDEPAPDGTSTRRTTRRRPSGSTS